MGCSGCRGTVQNIIILKVSLYTCKCICFSSISNSGSKIPGRAENTSSKTGQNKSVENVNQ